MKTISLSIEELIYSFYSEGLFEQGNSLKQMYFDEITDEQMDLLLQISCRTLLAKDFLVYESHKFELVPKLKHVIDTLNFSAKSLKASRHKDDGKEEAVSYHFTDKGFLQHSLLYDEQVHRFEFVEKEEMLLGLQQFFHIQREGDFNSQSISSEELEGMLSYITENGRQFDSLEVKAELDSLYRVLEKTNGKLNTLLLFEFDEMKEPTVKDIILLTNDVEGNLMLLQENANYRLVKGSLVQLEDFVMERESPNSAKEKENV
ncbi:hypothetical protein JOC95_000294 [Bacillus tianshenii]|uniref:Uncharacterized protein n=1 Tax=Sutcliffiella tianshenii TaxID=1463404 RepID=A0ABS2NVE1_9BACI|nr:hypothetical protein [Bacillus tianshenii]MBM7618452.1 hypothetical protein [Bacillus tianshenii]